MTICCVVLFTLFFAVRSVKLFGGSDAIISTTYTPRMRGEPIDLASLNYMFAVPKLDPRFGRVTVEHIRVTTSESDPQQTKTVISEIRMDDCRAVLEAKKTKRDSVFTIESLTKGEHGQSAWLCPNVADMLSIRGEKGDQTFAYIKIALKGCAL